MLFRNKLFIEYKDTCALETERNFCEDHNTFYDDDLQKTGSNSPEIESRLVFTDDNLLMCESCGNLFKTEFGFNMHRRHAHSSFKPFKCNICLKSFRNEIRLLSHLAMHNGTRPYKCTKSYVNI